MFFSYDYAHLELLGFDMLKARSIRDKQHLLNFSGSFCSPKMFGILPAKKRKHRTKDRQPDMLFFDSIVPYTLYHNPSILTGSDERKMAVSGHVGAFSTRYFNQPMTELSAW